MDQKELAARIEWAKRNLMFYVVFWVEFVANSSEKELEMLINKHLDILSELLKQRN